MPHVWLAGMMGVGKTTVGALVAEHLERPLVDTDGIVVESTGRTVDELFTVSEWLFRAHERSAVVVAAGHVDAVVATGGGAVLDAANRLVMASTGHVVVLTASIETIIERVGSAPDGRPLAIDPEAIAAIQADRRGVYADIADHTVDTTGISPERVAREVIACIGT